MTLASTLLASLYLAYSRVLRAVSLGADYDVHTSGGERWTGRWGERWKAGERACATRAGHAPGGGRIPAGRGDGWIHVSRRDRMTGSPAWWLENDPDDLFDLLYVIKEEATGATMGRDDAEAASA